MLAELRDHILSAVETDLAHGRSRHEAEQSAVASFGDPLVVATMIRHDQPLRRAAPLLIGVAAALGVFALVATPVSDLGTRSAAAAASCDEASVTQAVRSFFTAFNAGDQRGVRAAIAPPKSFGWYSVPGPDGRFSMQQAADRATLFSYFRERHQEGENMQVNRVYFTGIEGGERSGGGTFGGFTFTLARRAHDVAPVLVSGKGAVLCGTPNRIAVWSQALTTLPGMGPLDPIRITP